MKTNEAFGSESVVEAGKNGNGHSHTQTPREDSYPAAYAAGVAAGHEAAFRQGYQAGFTDGFKQTQEVPADATTGAPISSKKGDARLMRLRGLPCTECGVSMYSDEAECRCCRTPKAARPQQNQKPS